MVRHGQRYLQCTALGGDRLGVSSVINDFIYPNPSRDIFNVEFSTDEAQEVEIIVLIQYRRFSIRG